jgi:FkbM family methyltransferase
MAIRIAGQRHPLYLRLGSSDALVWEQIFIQREYSPFDNLVPEPKTMIDCGGNIGCSSIYFLNRYPDLRVIIVEPDADNLKLCRRNLEPYGERVQIIQAGVCSCAAGLVLSGTGWAARVRRAEPGEDPDIDATDMPSLLALTSDGRVDLLKIDIEWSELDVFREGSTAWLSSVDNIAIELHDAECKDVFFRALAGYRFELSEFGELTFCRGIRPAGNRELNQISLPI